jgi:formylglycine-generating enzyme required for sulfatase activity
MANIEVDFLILPTVRRLGEQWNWGIKALSPAQGAAQVWGGDQRVAGDAAEAAYAACDGLAREFACEQGVSSACVGSGFGAGPILGAEAAAPAQGSGPVRAQPARARMSALEVLEPTPQVVSVWIDGKEAGTSENQITGVPPGRHEVALKAPGYFDHTEQLTFAAGLPTELNRVRLRKTTATLRVEMVVPAVATVFIGGRERGTTANPLAGIAPGEVEVVLRADGYRERRERVTLEADKETVLKSSRLQALPATLTVTANIVGAEVLVDGAVVGTTTAEADAFEVAPTAKQLEVRRLGYAPFVQRLSLRAGGKAEVRATLSRVQATPAAPAVGRLSGATRGCPAGYVRISPGTFTMGSPTGEKGREDDETQHAVFVSRAFCMMALEVTQGEWQAAMGNNPSEFKNCGANCPVEQVSWDDAVGYANALSRREELPECYSGSTFSGISCKGYRLPTEAEWEYAARAGTRGATYGRDIDSVAWYDQNARGSTHVVLQKQPNAWGLYDMLGNVWEWTGDWYDVYPGRVIDPTGPVSGSGRVIRGGSWADFARYARASDRVAVPEGSRNSALGFRLVRTMP